jgi:hypothetical protein
MPAVAENMQEMSALEGIEEIAEQTKFSVNIDARSHHVRGPGRKLGWGISPAIEHGSPAREKPLAAPASKAPETVKENGEPEVVFAGDEVTTYTELIAGIQARLGELGIRQVDFDVLAGFAPGLAGKVFGPSQVKRLGPEKLFDAIRAAGLKLKLEAGPKQLERMRKQIAENCEPRQAKQARMGNRSHLSNKIIDDVLGYLANRKGGLAPAPRCVERGPLQLRAACR